MSITFTLMKGIVLKKAENVSDFYQKAEAFLIKYVINYKKHSNQGTKEHQ